MDAASFSNSASIPPKRTSCSEAPDPVLCLASLRASSVSAIIVLISSSEVFSSGKLMTTFSPRVSTVTSPVSIAFFNCLASSVASSCSAPSPPSPAKSDLFFLSVSLPSGESSVFVCNSSSGCCSSVVCCLKVSVIAGVGLGLNSNEITVVPFGCSTTGTTF